MLLLFEIGIYEIINIWYCISILDKDYWMEKIFWD